MNLNQTQDHGRNQNSRNTKCRALHNFVDSQVNQLKQILQHRPSAVQGSYCQGAAPPRTDLRFRSSAPKSVQSN